MIDSLASSPCCIDMDKAVREGKITKEEADQFMYGEVKNERFQSM